LNLPASEGGGYGPAMGINDACESTDDCEQSRYIISPHIPCQIAFFRVELQWSPSETGNTDCERVFTILDDFTNTTETCTITGPNTTCDGVDSAATVVGFSKIGIRWDANNAGTGTCSDWQATNAYFSFECQPLPPG
jgi:hypothetical protein